MSVFVQRAEFSVDRQFVDATVEVPDGRPGWSVVMLARGPSPSRTSPQPCAAVNGAGGASVRFYPFLSAGEYSLHAELVPPDAPLATKRPKRGERKLFRMGRAKVPRLDPQRAAAWLLSDGADLHQAASRSLVPLCVDSSGAPCFWPVRGVSPRRVAVLSIPKAGTYLLSNLVTNLGIVSCNVHIGRALVGDYRVSKQMPPPTQRYMDMAFSCRLVLPGQSMASHMGRDQGTEIALHSYAKIFAYRELRAALLSAYRTGERRSAGKTPDAKASPRQQGNGAKELVAWMRRGDLARMVRQYVGAASWHGHPDVCMVSFEDIMGDNGPEVQVRQVVNIASKCEIPINEQQARSLLTKSIGADTQTYSGARSNLREYWSQEAEDLFRNAGLEELNRTLGFADGWG